MITTVFALASQTMLSVPADWPPRKDFSSSEEIVWDGKEGKYTLFSDSIFSVTEKRKKLRHVVVRSETKTITHIESYLIDCKKKTWRDVWYSESGVRTITYVARRDYSMRASSPPLDSPMGAVIERVCRKS
ncbi:MAG: hypothetical protein H6918_09775 [Sphingomonadaceae bacterium]|nr:hypothetical protein [Sphingomonadaceae bacterium]